LDSISFELKPRRKVALVGRNGCGKSTLIRMLCGEETPDFGRIHVPQGTNIGYLAQNAMLGLSGTVKEVAEGAIGDLVAISEEISDLETQLADTGADLELVDDLTSRLEVLHAKFSQSEGYRKQGQLQGLLSRFGFRSEDFDRPVTELSGGETTRLMLVRLLLQEPDVLILDEPTNHLDIDAVKWLENWLVGYLGAVLLVSHDRMFLDKVAQEYWEIRGGKMYEYPGPYENFRKLKAEEQARKAKEFAALEARKRELDEYVRRFLNSERVSQARGRLKMLEKLSKVDLQVEKEQKSMRSNLKAAERGGDMVLRAEKLTKGFDGRTLFKDLNWTVSNGERWGIVGPNGSGKSTLIEILLEHEEPDSGSVRLGSRIEVGYFSQDQQEFDGAQTPLSHLMESLGASRQEAQGLLGSFLFDEAMVEQPIRSLSGGERNKLALATLVWAGPNLLILDEPSNHLDVESVEALVQLLQDFAGSLVLVSHDRYLLQQVTNRTLLFSDSGVSQHPGSVFDSLGPVPPRGNAQRQAARGAEKPETGMTQKELSKALAKAKLELDSATESVARVEEEIAEVEKSLAELSGDVHELSIKHHELSQQLEQQLEDWAIKDEAVEELERMRRGE
jgi:ATP-binding cassette subfamily F protein 3